MNGLVVENTGDLTAENVANAVRHFLDQEVTEGATSCPELLLQGVPDEKVAKLLEAKGGVIRIKISGTPAELLSAMKEEQGRPVGYHPISGGYMNSFIPDTMETATK